MDGITDYLKNISEELDSSCAIIDDTLEMFSSFYEPFQPHAKLLYCEIHRLKLKIDIFLKHTDLTEKEREFFGYAEETPEQFEARLQKMMWEKRKAAKP